MRRHGDPASAWEPSRTEKFQEDYDMVSIPTGLAINTAVSADRTIPSAFRRILSTLFVQVTPGDPVTGIIAGPGSPLLVTGDTGMNYNVSAGFAVTKRSGQGAYLVGTSSDVVVATSPADGTNSRIDVVYIVQPDPELGESGHARIDVAVGAPSGTPAEPSVPTGAYILGKKVVAPGSVGTNSGASIYGLGTTTGLYVNWATIGGKPTTFPPSTHTHTASQITDPLNLSVGNSNKVNSIKIWSQAAAPTTGMVDRDLWFS
jgi:hypothetical protein